MKKARPHARPHREVSRAEWALLILFTVYITAHVCSWLLELYLTGGTP